MSRTATSAPAPRGEPSKESRPPVATSAPRMAGGRPRWPARVDQLPVGPLREHVARAVGVRALLPVVRATSVQTTRRALNADAKTIATVTTDRLTSLAPAYVALPGGGNAPLLVPRLAACCQIAMGIAMAYLLIQML